MDRRFKLVALTSERFDPLRTLGDAELRARGARRMRVDEKPGYPCRVSLADAEVGEEVLLLPFTHHDVGSPYRASGPIFVRVGAETAHPGVNEVPAMIRSRLLSIRAYDAEAMLIASEIAEGRVLEEHIERLFSDPRVEYLHLHNARPGCYNCRVERA
ncbi:MAG: DUF1203 domain-containing protein [Candidatus Eiseniibacteriota bacterium]